MHPITTTMCSKQASLCHIGLIWIMFLDETSTMITNELVGSNRMNMLMWKYIEVKVEAVDVDFVGVKGYWSN